MTFLGCLGLGSDNHFSFAFSSTMIQFPYLLTKSLACISLYFKSNVQNILVVISFKNSKIICDAKLSNYECLCLFI